MTPWYRFKWQGETCYGILNNEQLHLHRGGMVEPFDPSGVILSLDEVEVLPPCEPGQFLALWNNFYSRAEKEGWDIPLEPLYFTKLSSCFNSHGKNIVRPDDYQGPVFFEGELGIVIGRPCYQITEQQADDYIFGYTCVNDVTAKEVLHRDSSFPQWTRAKGYKSFGVFGPNIATDLEPDELVVQSILDGEVKQEYPVTDMVFRPRKLVATLSNYVTLMPGDVIACGTGLGACAMQDGQTIQINIEGVGRLKNTMQG